MSKFKSDKKFILLIILIVAVISVVVFKKNKGYMEEKRQVKNSGKIQQVDSSLITVQQLKDWLKNKDFILVNVHVPYEGEIEGTDYNIDYRNIDEFERLFSKDQKIVIYCRSGAMSANAFKRLKERGFTNIYDVKGGMIAWQQMGEKLVFKK